MNVEAHLPHLHHLYTAIEGRLDCTGATLVCEQPTPANQRGTALEV